MISKLKSRTTVLGAAFWAATLVFGNTEEPLAKLPTSVRYTVIEGGKHEVTINGVATATVGIDGEKAPLGFPQTPMDYIPSIPERLSLKVDHDKRTCTLVTSRELKMYELSAAIDEVAKARSDIPCWAELEARDFEKSTEVRDDLYVIKKVNSDASSGLAWFVLQGSQGITVPFVVKTGVSSGRLVIVPMPVPIGSQPQYKIYVLDYKDRLIWLESSIVFGPARFAIGDSNGDYQHEIYIESYDGKDAKFFHVEPR
jgi:hypothetical protein